MRFSDACLAAVLTILALPAAAQDAAALKAATNGLAASDAPLQIGAAYAACLLGRGDVEATAAPFVDAGWTRQDDSEMGTTAFLPKAEGVYVTLYDNGAICSVSSETVGTETAYDTLVATMTAAGVTLEHGETADGCLGLTLSTGGTATLTSSGQDPVCQSTTTSDLRFLFD